MKVFNSHVFIADALSRFSDSLFPNMPRENNRYVAPLVKQMCEKHGITYLVKPSLYQAFYDVYA